MVLLMSFSSDSRRLSAHMTSQKLHNGKVIKVEGDVYYNYNEGRMVVHYVYPTEYFFVTNPLGEVIFYYPESNQVMLEQNDMLSSENDVLYFFLSNQTESLGLKEGGFELSDTRVEDAQVITTWIPEKESDREKIARVEMVHINYLPIYTGYYNGDEEIAKKIYYDEYLTLTEAMVPRRITEIEFLANGDSIISKKQYSDIKTGFEARSQYFDFTVPEDAERISINRRK